MKTMISAEPKGKACPPRRIPVSEKMTASKLQNAYDEIADQYDKKIWFDQHIHVVGSDLLVDLGSLAGIEMVDERGVEIHHQPFT